jgi:DNA-binding response OmpR family regulator
MQRFTGKTTALAPQTPGIVVLEQKRSQKLNGVRRELQVSTAKSRILIAEPDLDIQKTLQLYFEEHGHEVHTLDSPGGVIKAARPWQPGVILISTEAEDTDSYRVCEDLMEDTLTGHIPVIMLLHLNEREARLNALEAGASDAIPKPFDLEELHLRVEAAIRLATMRMGA